MNYKLKDQLPDIGKAYTIAMVLILVVAVMASSFVSGTLLLGMYFDLGLLLLLTYGQNNGWRYQKIHKKLRPFIVGRILQVYATLIFVFVALYCIWQAWQQGTWVPSIVFILLNLAMMWQYYQIFRLAHKRKEEHPEKCEFC